MNSEVVNKSRPKDIPLKLFKPDWNSDLANTIVKLEKLRVKQLGGPVPPYIFLQLKEIFQLLESLGSARIEGNRTTLAELVENVIETSDKNKNTSDESLREIFNIEHAINFIEENVNEGVSINRALLSEIHKIIVDGLTPPSGGGEGSSRPGEYRVTQVSIKKSEHVPPDYTKVTDYMEELLDFVNSPSKSQNDLLITALAHHRMAWIHPFDNGNGRMVRMFTYAMLIKQGFAVKAGRILNPTAIFCIDRNSYYDMLARADIGTKEDVLEWCNYVLKGLRSEIEKIDSLLDIKFITDNILYPTLTYALDRKQITQQEKEILTLLIKNDGMLIKSADIRKMIGQVSHVQGSRIIKKLKDKRMLLPLKQGGRIYTIGFGNNYLLRGVIKTLEDSNFIPSTLNISQ